MRVEAAGETHLKEELGILLNKLTFFSEADVLNSKSMRTDLTAAKYIVSRRYVFLFALTQFLYIVRSTFIE